MAANVLNSQRAIEASVYVVRAFVRMRKAMSSDRELARHLDSLEGRLPRMTFESEGSSTPSVR